MRNRIGHSLQQLAVNRTLTLAIINADDSTHRSARVGARVLCKNGGEIEPACRVDKYGLGGRTE